MMVLFLGLVAQLTYLQVVHSSRLENDPRQRAQIPARSSAGRGARSSRRTASCSPSRCRRTTSSSIQRVYNPDRRSCSRTWSGYQSIQFGSVGVEAEYSSELAGRGSRQPAAPALAGLVGPQGDRDGRALTVDRGRSSRPRAALAGRRGTVVVLDVQTGAVVAMYSNPTFDPNPLASHDIEEGAGRARSSCSRCPTTRCSPARGASSIRPVRRSRR